MRAMPLLALGAACAAVPAWQGADRRVREAFRRGDALAAARAMTALFERFNLPVTPPRDLAAWAARDAERIARVLGRGDEAARVLGLLLVAREVALAAQREHLETALVGGPSAETAAVHAVALVREIARRDPSISMRVSAALRRLEALPPDARRDLPSALWALARRFRDRVAPLEVVLARTFPTSFDRATTALVLAAPRARLCTLRSVDAPEGAVAGVSSQGSLWLAVPRAVREVPLRGPERRWRLASPLGPGRLVPAGARLYHLLARPGRLSITTVSIRPDEARREGILDVQGGGLLGDAALVPGGALLAFRRVFPGVRLVRIDPRTGQNRPEGILPGAPGHRDGPLPRARWSPGPAALLPRGAILFYDPVAGALRMLEKGWVGTVARRGDRRDGRGGAARVGRVVGVAAADDDRVYLAEKGRLEAGFRRFHLRLVRLSGGPCR